MLNIKTLSLVDCIELKFPGNILKEALCFGDVDNDGANELIVGTTDGELIIFKDKKCICRAFDLGCIVSIAVGDLLNIGKNVTVVVTTEGYCHVFDVEDELSAPVCVPDDESGREPSLSSLSVENISVPLIPTDFRVIQQFHTQRIVSNTKIMLLADVNDDGLVELILGLTDRIVRTYKWNPEPVSQYGMDLISEEADELSDLFDSTPYDGRLEALNKWELANQLGSIAIHSQGNLSSILIGQPGGTVLRVTEISETTVLKKDDDGIILLGKESSSDESRVDIVGKELPPGEEDHSLLRHPVPSKNISIKYHRFDSADKVRNKNVTTHVASNVISEDGKSEDCYAVGTWDGSAIMICKDETVEWSFSLEKPLLTVQSFRGNAIFVDWEGPTYLINRRLEASMQILRFFFEDHIAAFRVGAYGMQNLDSGNNKPLTNKNCFAYVTFHGSIYVYPNEFL